MVEKIVVVSSDEKFFCRQIADLRVKCQVNNKDAPNITYEWKIDGLDAGTEYEFTHDFAEQGDYRFDLQIKTIISESSGSSTYTLASASQTITVGDFVEPALQSADNQAPVLTDFDINYSFNRAAPSTILFDYGKYASDVDGAIDSYKIDLGNGVVKRVAQPKLSYVYNQGGAFNVKISAVDINGVESEVVEKIAIVLTDEKYFCRQIDYLRIKCQATNVYTSSTTYLWKVNNTEIGTERELVYDFSEPGEYKLEFIQLNPYANMTKIITVGDFVEPALQSADNQAPVLSQLDVHYLANRTSPTYVTLDYGKYASDPDGAIDSYLVDFGDGHSYRVAEGKKEHYFTKAGTYYAVVTAVDINGAESSPVQQVINILDHQDIDCLQTEALEITCGTAAIVNPGSILTWKVDSEDVGREKEFIHTVSEKGEYVVSLIITSIHGQIIGDFKKKVLVKDFNPIEHSPLENILPIISNVDIIYSLNNTAPADVTLDYAKYTTDVDGNIDSYRIDFGDGTIVRTRDSSYTHKYTRAGSYDVTIVALDNHYSEGFIKAKVTVLDSKDIVCKQSGALQATCEISAKYPSTNYVANWKNGSNVIGTGQKVSFSVDVPGEHLISMDLKYAFSGEPVGNFSEKITIGEYVAPAVASTNNSTPYISDFDIIYSINRTAQALVKFDYGKYATDADGPVDSYRIDFGDGKTVRLFEKSTQHQYVNAGTFNVVVTAVDNQGAESSIEKIVTILDSRSAVCKQTGDFEATCEAQFKYSFGHELTWIFNDEVIGRDSAVKHIFDSYGDYALTLRAVDLVTSQTYYYPVKVKIEDFAPIDAELSDLPSESNIKPVISRFDISYEVNNTAPTLVEFDYGKYATDFDGVIDSYKVEFGDGKTIRTTDAKVSHLYASAGTYYPSVTVVDNQGAEGRAEAIVTVLNTQDISCRQVGDLLVTCLASRKYESTHTYSLEWRIEGQVVGDQRELSYVFSAPGDYVVELSVTMLDNGNNTETLQEAVTIEGFSPNLAPTAQFTLDRTIVIQNELFTADAGSSDDPEGFPLEYVWKYSDGTIDKNFQSYHFFKQPGDHSIELTVTDHLGLSDTKLLNIVVRNDPSLIPHPVITSRDDGIEGALFADAIESWMPEGELTGFLWDLGDGTQYTTESIEHHYENAGSYIVSLTAYGSNNSSTTVTKEINIINPIDPTLVKSEAIVEVTGLDLEGFNPIVNNVVFLISGKNLFNDENMISIRLNDEEVSSSNIIKSGNQVELNAVLREGANSIIFEASDEHRNVIQETYQVIAGSKTLSIEVLDSMQAPSTDSIVKYRVLRNAGDLPIDSFLFEKEFEYSTSSAGFVVIENVPAQKGYVYAVNSLVHMDDQVVLSDGLEATLKLQGFNQPVLFSQAQFSNGLLGWSIDPQYTSLIDDELVVSVPSGEGIEYSTTLEVESNEGFLSFPISAKTVNKGDLVIVSMRNKNTGEVQVELIQHVTEYNDIEVIIPEEKAVDITLDSNISDIIEIKVKIIAGQAVPSFTSLFGQLVNAYAATGEQKLSTNQNSPTTSRLGIFGKLDLHNAPSYPEVNNSEKLSFFSIRNDNIPNQSLLSSNWAANVIRLKDMQVKLDLGEGIVGASNRKLYICGIVLIQGVGKYIFKPTIAATPDTRISPTQECVTIETNGEGIAKIEGQNFILNEEYILNSHESINFSLIVSLEPITKEDYYNNIDDSLVLSHINTRTKKIHGQLFSAAHLFLLNNSIPKTNFLAWSGINTEDKSEHYGEVNVLDGGDSWALVNEYRNGAVSHFSDLAYDLAKSKGASVGDISKMNGGLFYTDNEPSRSAHSAHKFGKNLDLMTPNFRYGKKSNMFEIIEDAKEILKIDKNEEIQLLGLSILGRPKKTVKGVTDYGDSKFKRLETASYSCINKKTSNSLIHHMKTGHFEHWHIEGDKYIGKSSTRSPHVSNIKHEPLIFNLVEMDETVTTVDGIKKISYKYDYSNIGTFPYVNDSNTFGFHVLKNKTEQLYSYSQKDGVFLDNLTADPGLAPSLEINNQNNVLTITYSPDLMRSVDFDPASIFIKFVGVNGDACTEIDRGLLSIEDCGGTIIAGTLHPNGGGFVSIDSFVNSEAFIGRDAKICGASRIEGANTKILGNVLVNNSNSGGCELDISGYDSGESTSISIESSKLCENSFGSISVYGNSINMSGKVRIDGNISIGPETNISGLVEINGTGSSESIIEDTVISGETLISGIFHIGNAEIRNSTIKASNVVGMQGSGVDISGASVIGSSVTGYGLINGDITDGANFSGIAPIQSSNHSQYFINHITSRGHVTGAKTVVSGNGEISGTISNGGKTQWASTASRRSHLHSPSSIQGGGNVSGVGFVKGGGILRSSISNGEWNNGEFSPFLN